MSSHDQLSTPNVRNLVRFAEAVQLLAPFHTQPRFERSWRVVDAGVNDTAVVGAGLESRAWMALDHACRESVLGHRRRRCQPADARADDRHVNPRQR